MIRRRSHIRQKRRIFLGCEGASEASYAALLQRLADSTGDVRIHIVHRKLNPGAGDPRQLVKRAEQIIIEEERKRVPFALKALLLDRAEPDHCLEAIKFLNR